MNVNTELNQVRLTTLLDVMMNLLVTLIHNFFSM